MDIPDAAVLAIAGAFGALLGSFLNVVIHRMPQRKSIVWPGSSCPACGESIRWYDNIPILSWLALGGKCRACKARISPRYLLVEALMAGLTVFVVERCILQQEDLLLFAAALLLVGALVAITFIDTAHRIIPDRITKPGMILAPIFSLLAPALHQTSLIPDLTPPRAAILLSLLGMAVGSGSIWLIGVLGKIAFKKEAMGFGDVKFMGMVGGFTGPIGVLLVILLACISGSVIGLVSWAITRSRYIPFGPFLSLGTFVLLFWRPEVVEFITVTYPSLFR